jgi:hypothetical protein
VKPKFSQGTWKQDGYSIWSHDENGHKVKLLTVDWRKYGWANGTEVKCNGVEALANLKLFAASRELLAACQAMLSSFAEGGRFDDAHALVAKELMMDAIEKAVGGK